MGESSVSVSEGAAAYAERMKRIMDAVELRQPDRTPTAFFSTFWTARYGGISYRQAMYDYDGMSELTKRAVLEMQPIITRKRVLFVSRLPPLPSRVECTVSPESVEVPYIPKAFFIFFLLG